MARCSRSNAEGAAMSRLAPALPLLAALCLPLAARALDETPLSMVHEPAVPTTAPTPNTQKQAPVSSLPRLDGCRLPVRTLADLRPNKKSAGAMILMIEGQPAAVPVL